jgi:hypothetical protein
MRHNLDLGRLRFSDVVALATTLRPRLAVGAAENLTLARTQIAFAHDSLLLAKTANDETPYHNQIDQRSWFSGRRGGSLRGRVLATWPL